MKSCNPLSSCGGEPPAEAVGFYWGIICASKVHVNSKINANSNQVKLKGSVMEEAFMEEQAKIGMPGNGDK